MTVDAYMKKFLFILMITLVACSGGEDTPQPETIPPPEPQEIPEPESEPIVLEPEEPETAPTPEDKEYYAIPDKVLSGVSCDGDALTFTITNTVEKTWSLDLLSFPPPTDKDQLKIFINGYEPWRPDRYFSEGSLKDCTDALVEPGESFSCTVKPVPVITENAFSRNTIQVKAPRINEQANFKC